MSGLNFTRVLSFSLLALSFTSIYSCKFNPNLQGTGRPEIQGVWEEGEVAYQNERLQYSKHNFRFSCDSVYITINTFAKVSTYPDSCFNNGKWTEYAKGVYETQNDTLIITATFTKPDFKQKISGCYRNGQYLPVFVIRKSPADSLYLEGLTDHSPLSLAIKQRINCVPKPLR